MCCKINPKSINIVSIVERKNIEQKSDCNTDALIQFVETVKCMENSKNPVERIEYVREFFINNVCGGHKKGNPVPTYREDVLTAVFEILSNLKCESDLEIPYGFVARAVFYNSEIGLLEIDFIRLLIHNIWGNKHRVSFAVSHKTGTLDGHGPLPTVTESMQDLTCPEGTTTYPVD